MNRFALTVAVALLACAGEARAQGRARAAGEAAELLIGRYGAKAGRSVPELAGRIEALAAKHGDEVFVVLKKSGAEACGLIEAAGPDGAKALRVLATHGEQGASRVLSRPTAMKQYLQHGDVCASALVRHPGVAEPLIERGGAQAVKALGAVEARNGRRLAMLLDGELAQVGRHPEVLGVVAKHGDRAVNFLWEHRATLAGAAALTAFLSDPEPYLNGLRDISAVAGESVVKPVVGGVVTLATGGLVLLGVLILGVTVLIHKHGLPGADTIKGLAVLFKK